MVVVVDCSSSSSSSSSSCTKVVTDEDSAIAEAAISMAGECDPERKLESPGLTAEQAVPGVFQGVAEHEHGRSIPCYRGSMVWTMVQITSSSSFYMLSDGGDEEYQK